MKLARIEYQGEVCEATVTCNGFRIESPQEIAGAEVGEDEVRLLPPVAPGKILGVGFNFREHIKEMVAPGRARTGTSSLGPRRCPHPMLFLKPPSSMIGHRDAIVYPLRRHPGGVRGRVGGGHRPRHAPGDARGGEEGRAGLDLRQRRHRARPAGRGQAVVAGQGLRHLRCGRAVSGDRGAEARRPGSAPGSTARCARRPK